SESEEVVNLDCRTKASRIGASMPCHCVINFSSVSNSLNLSIRWRRASQSLGSPNKVTLGMPQKQSTLYEKYVCKVAIIDTAAAIRSWSLVVVKEGNNQSAILLSLMLLTICSLTIRKAH